MHLVILWIKDIKPLQQVCGWIRIQIILETHKKSKA
jgi:hypothetical protein